MPTSFAQRFGVEEGGNAPSDPQGEFAGKNLLYTAQSVDEVAARTGRQPRTVIDGARRAPRMTLFERAAGAAAAASRRQGAHRLERADDRGVRARRARARARRSAASPSVARHLAAAQRAARFLHDTMWDAERQVLLRRYRDGDAAIDGYAEDYAYLIFGLLELFQADGDPGWLEWAAALQTRQDELFWDAADGGWFSTTGADPTVLLRLKEDYDGAEPAASSVVGAEPADAGAPDRRTRRPRRRSAGRSRCSANGCASMGAWCR